MSLSCLIVSYANDFDTFKNLLVLTFLFTFFEKVTFFDTVGIYSTKKPHKITKLHHVTAHGKTVRLR